MTVKNHSHVNQGDTHASRLDYHLDAHDLGKPNKDTKQTATTVDFLGAVHTR